MPSKRRTITRPNSRAPRAGHDYDHVLGGVVELLESARRGSARAVNAIMTATYWEIGRRIVEFEQGGRRRAEYGEEIMSKLSTDLTTRFGRGFSRRNIEQMRNFCLAWPKAQTPSALLSGRGSGGRSLAPKAQTSSAQSPLATIASRFPLPWSHYVRLLTVENPDARRFYETEALRGGWSVRQLDRQVGTMFFERTALSRNKAAMLRRGHTPQPGEKPSLEEEIKSPFILEFLDLKDEYSETDLENEIIRQLEGFLLELGGEFTFVGRQRRLRIDDEWYRIDLLFYHRVLRCLIVIDLKLGRFTHADAGQMHLYLNYADEHWTMPGENQPVGIILCASKGESVAKYALAGLPNKILAAEYRTALPSERDLAKALTDAQRAFEARRRPLNRRKR